MCPCPICATLLILLSPLLIFKKSRRWIKNKIWTHHCQCDTCQQAEHDDRMRTHTACSCMNCHKKGKKK